MIGGCHSLIKTNGVLRGDPLEASALEGIRWDWDPSSRTASPIKASAENSARNSKGGDVEGSHKKASRKRRRKFAEASSEVENEAGTPGDSGSTASPGRQDEATEGERKGEGEASPSRHDMEEGLDDGRMGEAMQVTVWRRHAFSSQLQRMSVVAEVSGAGLTADKDVPEVC